MTNRKPLSLRPRYPRYKTSEVLGSITFNMCLLALAVFCVIVLPLTMICITGFAWIIWAVDSAWCIHTYFASRR